MFAKTDHVFSYGVRFIVVDRSTLGAVHETGRWNGINASSSASPFPTISRESACAFWQSGDEQGGIQRTDPRGTDNHPITDGAFGSGQIHEDRSAASGAPFVRDRGENQRDRSILQAGCWIAIEVRAWGNRSLGEREQTGLIGLNHDRIMVTLHADNEAIVPEQAVALRRIVETDADMGVHATS